MGWIVSGWCHVTVYWQEKSKWPAVAGVCFFTVNVSANRLMPVAGGWWLEAGGCWCPTSTSYGTVKLERSKQQITYYLVGS